MEPSNEPGCDIILQLASLSERDPRDGVKPMDDVVLTVHD